MSQLDEPTPIPSSEHFDRNDFIHSKIDPILPKKRANRILVLLLSIAMTVAVLIMITVYYLAAPDSFTSGKRNIADPESLYQPDKRYYPPVDWKLIRMQLEVFQIDGKNLEERTLSRMDYRYFFYSTADAIIIPNLPPEYTSVLVKPPVARITFYGKNSAPDAKEFSLQEIEILTKNIFRVRSHLPPLNQWVYYSDPNLELFEIIKFRPDIDEPKA